MQLRLLFLLSTLGSMPLHAQPPSAPPVRTFQPNAAITTAVVDSPITVPTTLTQGPGELTVHDSPRIEKLMRDYAEHRHPQQGFRVQIFLGDRKTAEETKRSFLLKHPEIPAYMSWLAPNFRLRVGDMHTRLEAERLLRDLRVEHPGSYIVPDEVEMRRLGER
mgnify:FL=1